MKLPLKISEFSFKMKDCVRIKNYDPNAAPSSYYNFCQKLYKHPLKIDASNNRITIIPIQTDEFAPNDRFLNGTSTGNLGVHKIWDKDSEQVTGPTLVYNIKEETEADFLHFFFKLENSEIVAVQDAKEKLRDFNFNSHLENNKKNEIHIFETNELILRHAKKVEIFENGKKVEVVDLTVSMTKNPVYQHVNLLFNRRYKDFSNIKTATHLSETIQDFFSNPGTKYATKDLKKMAVQQENVLEKTLQSNTFTKESEYQKYYELKISAQKVKKLVDKDSYLD